MPAEAGFATKPVLAERMIVDALDVGVTARWVTGDEVYGGDPKLRSELESRSTGYVFAIACDHHVTTGAGRVRADDCGKRFAPSGELDDIEAAVGVDPAKPLLVVFTDGGARHLVGSWPLRCRREKSVRARRTHRGTRSAACARRR